MSEERGKQEIYLEDDLDDIERLERRREAHAQQLAKYSGHLQQMEAYRTVLDEIINIPAVAAPVREQALSLWA